jgi:DNA-binding SARP family transcriptional activator
LSLLVTIFPLMPGGLAAAAVAPSPAIAAATSAHMISLRMIVPSFRSLTRAVHGAIIVPVAIESLSSGYGPRWCSTSASSGRSKLSETKARSMRLGGPKQRATLAILLLDANRVVSVERLADALYAGAAPVTAVTQVQRQISDLRKVLPGPVIETRSPGYVIHVSPEQLDLNRFERRAEEATQLLARGEAQRAADLLREALALWRGRPLADLAYESFAQTAIERLEEIRLAALEQRIEADLALGRHRDLVGELEQITSEQPTRERFGAQLMVALYRSGRQPEALDVYRRTRETLMQEFGIEPTPRLRELERAILTQDRSLDLGGAVEADCAVLVLTADEVELDELRAIAEPLARAQPRELIVACLLVDESALANRAAALNAQCASPANARTAVFTTDALARDTVRLARTYDVELVLLDLPHVEDELPDHLAEILDGSPADVAMLAGSVDAAHGDGVFVPFGGGDHDWAALELGAWLALGTNAPLRLVGTVADPRRERRDASRLLADASRSAPSTYSIAR